MEFRKKILQLIDRDLITVQKPGRYVGGEFNQIRKNWEQTPYHAVLAFPDIYDIGFPNLGIAALYNIINSRSDTLAERVFAPWFDMEDLLRAKDVPLFSLESKTPVADFDLVGFSLPYETLYTNVLNMLDLSRIPIFSKDRSDSDPLIIAGGHATYNPEPMAPFIDAFVIGEGEIAINEIMDTLLGYTDQPRREKINALQAISGIYVPSAGLDGPFNYPVSGSNHVKDSSKEIVQKRFIKKLEKPIQNFLVPNINVVHDRIAIEIMRGCSRGCRFCQAGMIMRPVRELGRENIISAVKESIDKTGISEISLLSLSTSDHSEITPILDDINALSEQFQLDFSLPSLRIESFDQKMMDAMKTKRKGNFTIAPEAGSETRRAAINKPIPTSDILETVEQICKKGWNNIKLYFMIGFPGETQEDIDRIIDLCGQIKAIGKNALRGRFKLNVSINTLIPKAHTPYQWAPLETRESVNAKYARLIQGLRPLQIKVNYPDHDLIQLEALLSRGDRYISNLIYQAWKGGAKFDAWHEGFSAEIWHSAAQEIALDLDAYLYHEREIDQSLPWDHIKTGVNKSYLVQEYAKSATGELTSGCFQRCAACGINQNLTIDCAKARVGQL